MQMLGVCAQLFRPLYSNKPGLALQRASSEEKAGCELPGLDPEPSVSLQSLEALVFLYRLRWPSPLYSVSLVLNPCQPSGCLLLFDYHHIWHWLWLFRVYTQLPHAHTPFPGNKASALPNLLSIGHQTAALG